MTAKLNLTTLDVRDSLAVVAAGGFVYGSWEQFQPFKDYTGGLNVSLAGDLNGNGYEDVVIGAGEGGGPRVAIVDTRTHEELVNFFAFERSFRGGTTVAVDGRSWELLVGAGRGGGPVVAVYDLRTFREIRRDIYGEATDRGGVNLGGDSGAESDRELSLGLGTLPIYLDLGDLSPSQSRFAVAEVYQLFEPIGDLIRVTNKRPVGYQSDYLSVVRDDLSYYPVDVSGLAVAVYSRRQPQSHTPTSAYVSDLVPVKQFAAVAAHEIGHMLGLWHSPDPKNLMHAPAPVDGVFSDGQFAEMRTEIKTANRQMP